MKLKMNFGDNLKTFQVGNSMSISNDNSVEKVKLEVISDTNRETETTKPDTHITDYQSDDLDNNIMSSDKNDKNVPEDISISAASPEPVRYNTLPYIGFRSPVKGGRKVLGNIVSVIILIVSVAYTVTSIIYYSDPPNPISKGLLNALKEIICFILAVLLVLSRFFPLKNRENVVLKLIGKNREAVSLILGAVGAIVHFYTLIRWYVQEGRVYVWYSDNGLTYTLNWDVKLIMITVLVGFILNFVEFSLMLLTKMRPKYQDLNPHLTVFIEQQKLLERDAKA